MRSLMVILIGSLFLVLYVNWKDANEKRSAAVEKKNAFNDALAECYYSPFLKAKAPYFEGSVGFLIPDNFNHMKEFSFPWKIKTYVQAGPEIFKPSNVTLPERIRVEVLKEVVFPGRIYTAYLLIKCLDTLKGSEFIIRDNSFCTLPYWSCKLEQAVRQAPVLAKFNPAVKQPVINGGWVSSPENYLIICTGVSGIKKEFITGYVYDKVSRKANYQEATFNKEELVALQY